MALLARGGGYLVGRANAGRSPLDGRPSSGAVLAPFNGEAVSVGEIEALLGPKDGPLRAQLRGTQRRGRSCTIGQFFALRGGRRRRKHVFVGETRVASKLLPSPGWEPSWSTGTAVSGPIVDATADNVSGCEPSGYQPQKCPIDPAANPVIDRRPPPRSPSAATRLTAAFGMPVPRP